MFSFNFTVDLYLYFPTSNKMAIIGTLPSWFSDKKQQLYKGSQGLLCILEPKKSSILIFCRQFYWSRTNYCHFFLAFVRLFLCSPIHPFKSLIILNVTNQLTLDGNIKKNYAHDRIRDMLVLLLRFSLSFCLASILENWRQKIKIDDFFAATGHSCFWLVDF
jgi:hypothetical protein